MTLQQFKDKYLGKPVEFHSFGSGAFNQCVDLVNRYINDVLDNNTKDYTEIIGTNAKDFNTKYDPEDFDWIANTPSGVPIQGDIVVWNGKAGGGAGHVAIFLDGNTNSFRSLDQNWSQKERVTIETHNYTNVSGWLRPKKMEKETCLLTNSPEDQETFSQLVAKSTNSDKFAAAGYMNVEDVQKALKEKDITIQNLTKDLKFSEDKIDQIMEENTELQKKRQEESEKDTKAIEELITAQHALQPYKDNDEKIRRELGIFEESDIIEAIKALKKSKVKKEEVPTAFTQRFIYCLNLLFARG